MTRQRRRPKTTATEIFLAAVGVGVIALVVAMIATSGSCRWRLAPELGSQPAQPTRGPAH